MHHMFTPSSRKGKEYQLFLPFMQILPEKFQSESVGGLEASIATQIGLKYAGNEQQVPDDIREQQAAALEKNKREADKQKAEKELKLDKRDVDDTMTPKAQQEIFDKIKQQRGSNQPHHSSGIQFQGENQRLHQGNGEAGAKQNFNHENQRLYRGNEEANAQHNFSRNGEHYHSGSNHERNVQSYPQEPILRAGEMGPSHSQVEPSYYRTDPSHPQNQQRILRAGGDNMFLGNEGQPIQYYAHASNFQHPPMGGGVSQFSGIAQQMQPDHPAHHPGIQHYEQQLPPHQGNCGGGLHPPCSSSSYQAPYPNQPRNYHTQQPDNVPPQGYPFNPYNLEVTSIVQYGDDPNFTGVIKQIHGEMAGVEMVSLSITGILLYHIAMVDTKMFYVSYL